MDICGAAPSQAALGLFRHIRSRYPGASPEVLSTRESWQRGLPREWSVHWEDGPDGWAFDLANDFGELIGVRYIGSESRTIATAHGPATISFRRR